MGIVSSGEYVPSVQTFYGMLCLRNLEDYVCLFGSLRVMLFIE
ncbi:MAG: hypothetical protein ACI92G_003714 [Candidatus Pelagisphaera sp.]|jgi:hypothetical protein